jgi:hypothetical protein
LREWLSAANFRGKMPLPQKLCLLRKTNSDMGIFDTWNQYREAKKNQRQKESDLVDLIERMVQDSDPSIRRVAGYRKKLQQPVENALGHIEGLVSSIPGPSRLAVDAWSEDPLIHALFVSPEETRSLLQSSIDLKSFFQKTGAKTAVALLTASKKERTVFGTAQEGEIIRRDVPQVAVEFLDHRVVAPGVDEAENRRELFHRALYVLATHTLEEILRIHSIREELSEERRVLAVKLKIQHSRQRGLEGLLSGSGAGRAADEEAQELLEQIDHQLMELGPGSGTPQDFLRQLEKALLNPENFLTGKTLRMHLNWMGVKQSEDSVEKAPEITLAELEIPGKVKRVAVMAAVSAAECLGR